MAKVGITGFGQYLPAQVVTNDDVERATPYPREAKGCSLDDWVRRRHGCERRHRAPATEAVSDLATRAGTDALADAELKICQPKVPPCHRRRG